MAEGTDAQSFEEDWRTLIVSAWGTDDENWTAPEPTRYVPKECMCTSRELLLNGCTCGYVDKQSWDEKLKNIDQRK
jgi:hypothetical protein